jgi:hypothetical protein
MMSLTRVPVINENGGIYTLFIFYVTYFIVCCAVWD